MKSVIAYVATLVVFAGVDLVWLGLIANSFYKSQLGPLMADRINLGAAVAFYLIYAVGLMIFAVLPASESGGWTKGLMLGALFGFFAYATYDLTNLATLKGWPLPLSIVDIAWGSLLSGIAAAGGMVAQRF